MRTTLFHAVGLVALSGVLTLSSALAGPLTGDTIDATAMPAAVQIAPSSAVVGANVEFVGSTGNLALVDFDFGASGLRVTVVDGFEFNGSASTFSFVDATHPFTSESLVSSTIPGLTAAQAFLSDGALTVVFPIGTFFTNGSSADFDLGTTPDAVPEPESLALLAIGLLGTAATVRRRRRAA